MDATPPPKQMQLALISRFKIMSSMDIAERRLPPGTGACASGLAGKTTTCACPSCPRCTAKRWCCASWTKSNLSASIDKLGLDPATFQQFKAAVDAPHGLILVTGPTGSGKTTTLYFRAQPAQ